MVAVLIAFLTLRTSRARRNVPFCGPLLVVCQLLMGGMTVLWGAKLLGGNTQEVAALVPIADAINHHHQSTVGAGCRGSAFNRALLRAACSTLVAAFNRASCFAD